MIFGLVGEKLSGKDTAAQFIQSKTGAVLFRHAGALDEILTMFDLPLSRSNLITLGIKLREAFGAGVLAGWVRKQVLAQPPGTNIVITDIRYPDELQNAKSLGAKIVYITAPLETRYKRYLTRGEKPDDGQGSFEDFAKIEQTAPTESGIAQLGSRADITIINDGTLEELHHKLDDILR
ncbi:MAG TPA: hypothetical protein VEA59_03980 [Patescibacteria group bacterium]|nr:hypothetical protein [Patescibacteria group bacterium]